MQVFLVDLGQLLQDDDSDFDLYNGSYDHKYGYMGEELYYCINRKQAIAAAEAWTKETEGNYAVVSESEVPDSDLENCNIDGIDPIDYDESYAPENVIYSCCTIYNEFEEDFIEGQQKERY